MLVTQKGPDVVLCCESPVTVGMTLLYVVAVEVLTPSRARAVGADVVIVVAGLSGLATDVACEACPLAASLLTRSTLDPGHLCLLAVLRDANFRPHPLHCRSQVGSLATFAASRSLSRLAAWLRFRARRLFSFWALLALQPPRENHG